MGGVQEWGVGRRWEEPGPGETLNILSSRVMSILENARSCRVGTGVKGLQRGGEVNEEAAERSDKR